MMVQNMRKHEDRYLIPTSSTQMVQTSSTVLVRLFLAVLASSQVSTITFLDQYSKVHARSSRSTDSVVFSNIFAQLWLSSLVMRCFTIARSIDAVHVVVSLDHRLVLDKEVPTICVMWHDKPGLSISRRRRKRRQKRRKHSELKNSKRDKNRERDSSNH